MIMKKDIVSILDRYGKIGVDILRQNTPVDTGKTAESWGYEIHKQNSSYEIIWTNTNLNDNVSVAILIQYGHATRNGGYVYGTDYINPSMREVFDSLADEIWKEVEAS